MDQVLQESTRVAQEAAGMIGGTFEQGVGFKANSQTANNARERTKLKTEIGTPTTSDLESTTGQITPMSVRPNTASAGIFGATDALIEGFQADLAKQLNQAGQSSSKLLNELQSSYSRLATKGQRTAELEEEQGIATKSEDVTKITNDLITKKRMFENERRALLEAPGLTASQKNAELKNMERLQAQELADLSIQQLVAQNSLDSARALVDRKVQLEFGDEEARIEALKFFYTENKEIFTKAEERLFNSQLQVQEQTFQMEKSKFETLEKTKLELMARARQNGAPASVISAIQASNDLQGAFNIAGEYGVDTKEKLQEQVLRSQLSTDAMQRQKLQAEIDSLASVSTITTGEYSDALNVILGSGKFTKDQKASVINAINNGESPATVIKNQAKNLMNAPQATDVANYETAKGAMQELEKNLNAFYAKGGSTSVFKGNFEKTINRLGEVKDPELVDLAVQIQSNLQVYRNAISGTAYSVQEGKDISSIFPGIDKTQGLNDAIISGRMKAFDATIDSAYKSVLGDKVYSQIKTIESSNVLPENDGSDDPLGIGI